MRLKGLKSARHFASDVVQQSSDRQGACLEPRFDFSVPQDEQSPQFYVHLLQTHDLLGDLRGEEIDLGGRASTGHGDHLGDEGTRVGTVELRVKPYTSAAPNSIRS